MKNLLSVVAAAGLAFSLVTAHAADAPAAAASAPAKAPTAQQGKMATCNADAKTKALKGDERKAFMKDCLSADKQAAQQGKMTTCNADAKTKALKGDERKAFMKQCLSNKPAA
ncbi:PsiF family protein [Paracidovorax valerianellae]|uniref:PsiF repeat-containing protein n=1 Tax=Paracidovorax valerianellae TaxID=187868 RepID=A0A1G7AVI9_9BURK|nr:PsiF family protein [Paracidovorax valerianellae]MDA8446176.1 PsiF family protein [Paracidovorax valerianellae]SDE18710.1 psiF repeat-containing protein [Paracidovorax valerianellae]